MDPREVNVKERMVHILLTLMGAGLLIFTGSRTLDLISSTFPAGQQHLAYLGLVAFDGGLVLWTAYFIKGARGSWQRGTSALMILVSLVGVLGAFAADTFYRSAESGMLAVNKQDMSMAIWGVVVVVAANVAAVTVIHLTDPQALRTMAEEEARDKIEEAAIKQISENATTLAAELAPLQGRAWVDDMRARYRAGDKPTKELEVVRRVEDGYKIVGTASSNGHGRSSVNPTQPPSQIG